MHTNNGACPYCSLIINKYANFHPELHAWFTDFQSRHPEAHTSCAGRGCVAQDSLFMDHATHARWGHSAHNYNAALDLFEMNGPNIYDRKWFDLVLAPEIPDWIEWYGRPGSVFFELPHLEVKGWKSMNLKLVEDLKV